MCAYVYDWDWLKIWHITCKIPFGVRSKIFIASLMCEQFIWMVDLIRFGLRNLYNAIKLSHAPWLWYSYVGNACTCVDRF